MQNCDVIVVGAGPAGTAAATRLARDGIDVVLVDKARFPRDKICGDGLTALALDQLEDLGLVPEAVADWMWAEDCWVRSPGGHTVHFPLPRDRGRFVAVAPRAQLDAALLDLARTSGAKVLEGVAVTGATETADGVQVRLDDDTTATAAWVVAADGMWSPMRKLLGVHPEGYRGEWHAFRQYASGVTGLAATDMYIAFEADLLPGYFWTFPLPGGRANIGFGIERGGKVALNEMGPLWDDLLTRPYIAEVLGPEVELEGSHRAWPIPARVDRMVAATRRVLFTGDALGACDLMTGEGIGQALLTGSTAARVISDAGPHGDAAAAYRAAVRSELVADHRMSELLVRALRHRKGARAAVRVAGATPWTRRNFARWLFEDYPRAIVATPRRWHRGLVSPRGSYLQE